MKSVYSILIFDIISKGGHYITFNQYILDNFLSIEEANPVLKFSFLYNLEAKELLHISESINDRVFYLDASISTATNYLNKQKILNQINRFTNTNPVDHLIMLEFDKYQLPLLFNFFNCAISGILFRPHHRIPVTNHSWGKAIASRFNQLKKRFADTLLSKHPAIENIFILNDTDGADELNQFFNSKKFKFLPDPVFTFNSTVEKINSPYNEPETYKFLIFGWLDERKNITNILQAYNSAEFSYKTTLLLIGPARPDYLIYLNNLILSLNTIDNQHKSVFIRAEFVSNAEMEHHFSLVDVCLLIYKDFFYSSGLIGRAALHHKKVIGTDAGVIEQLTRKYRLGISCDPHHVQAIAQALMQIKDYELNPDLCTEFYQKHSPEAFLSALVDV